MSIAVADNQVSSVALLGNLPLNIWNFQSYLDPFVDLAKSVELVKYLGIWIFE